MRLPPCGALLTRRRPCNQQLLKWNPWIGVSQSEYMTVFEPFRGGVRPDDCRISLVLFGVAAMAVASQAAAQQQPPPAPAAAVQTPQSGAHGPHTHMAESIRASIDKVVVVAGTDPTNQEIQGTYEDATLGVYGGIAKGSQLGNPTTQIGGVTVGFPIPVLQLPGAIVGGIAGKAQREAQEFRDELTEELAQATGQPLTNDGLALDVFRSLQRLPGLESKLFAATTPVPEDADATLYASITGVSIVVDGDEAVLTTTAGITLKRNGDDTNLYQRTVTYEDHATLRDWNRDDKRLWHDYANYARHYLGRELSAEAFDRVRLTHTLRPKSSKNVKVSRKNQWQVASRSKAPVLAWESEFEGGDAYGPAYAALDEATISYDVEVYDDRRLVYAQDQVPDPMHQLVYELQDCKEYRWSVRPVYQVNDRIKFGDWMRSAPTAVSGIVGRGAVNGPAYTQDFATLEIDCR